jgi:hypothetical protein
MSEESVYQSFVNSKRRKTYKKNQEKKKEALKAEAASVDNKIIEAASVDNEEIIDNNFTDDDDATVHDNFKKSENEEKCFEKFVENSNVYNLTGLFQDLFSSDSYIENDIDEDCESTDSSTSSENCNDYNHNNISGNTKSLSIPKLTDFNVVDDVDKLVTTMVWNIKESNNRNISHLYSVGNLKSEFSTGNF